MVLKRRHALWPLIIVAHVGVLALLVPCPPAPTAQQRPWVELRLLPIRAAAPRPERGPRISLVAPVTRQAAPEPSRDLPLVADPPPVPADPAEALPAATPDPQPTTPLLNSEATRRAVRLATRGPLLSERAASASDDPGRETAQQRFGREVARTAYGNCLKGEFPGGGMGQLSVPFWIAAELSGKCRK